MQLMQQKPLYIPVLQIGGFYFLWVTIHYGASHLYTYWCTPLTWIGFIRSPLLVTTPQCTALRWAIYHGSDSIHGMWIVLGSWIILCFQRIQRKLEFYS